MKIVALTHDILGDPFWNAMISGFRDAERALDVRIEHRRPEVFTTDSMLALMEAAISERPDGLITTLPQPDSQDRLMHHAAAQGLPVMVINTVDFRDLARQAPRLGLIASDDREGGRLAAEVFLERGCRRALCIDHYLIRNVCHIARSESFINEMRAGGATAEVLHIDPAQPDATSIVAQILPRVDCVLTLGPPGQALVHEALGCDEIYPLWITFDLSHSTLDLMEADHLEGVLDCQQYVQGYQSVTALVQYLRWNFVPPPIMSTGPVYLTKSKVGHLRQRLISNRG